jgi:hypothetical protein
MTIRDLIKDYLSAVDGCLYLFNEKFGRRDIVRAWKEGVIPQSGELSANASYRMHGVGCAVEFPEYDVDFDFAKQDEVGFDPWRLWRYAKQFPRTYPDYQELTAVEAAVAGAVADMTVSRMEGASIGESNDNLFQLNASE